MYTEIVKIIEGGLVNDREKIINYANMLADNLEKDGEHALSKKIRSILLRKKGMFTSLDSFATKPVDAESRMDIVEISIPQIVGSQIVLSKYIKEELSAFIECYKHQDSFLKAGIEPANSLLLYGPPGCGKTTIAQYISTITELPLITASLDGVVSSLLGSTAKNIRKIFDYAEKRECILFLDEFDVIAKLRDDKNELGELKRVVNSLIQNIDRLNNNSILIAATNHHELLDAAIWRRFSKILLLEKPKKEEIGKLLTIFLRDYENKILDNEKRVGELENAFYGCSHSDIKTVINNTIRNAIIKNRFPVINSDVFRGIYLHKKHSIENEDAFIRYLLQNGVTHREINENLGISLRKIQTVSKNEIRED